MAELGSIGVGHQYAVKYLNTSPLSDRHGIGHSYAMHQLLPTLEPITTMGERHSSELASKNIPVWSNRGVVTYTNAAPQVYALDTPGIIAGKLHTSVIVDYNHIVRLYYRPNGYLIDQVRTSADGSFVFNRNVDKAEMGNYCIIAFDLNNNFNAVVYDLLVPA